ncbi:hypothetical protein [Ferruginibacter sp.]|nr:hypothetical protein [Ferruginibacter sp.]
MKKTLLFFTLVFWTIQTYSQTDDWEMYYPKNSLLKKLKVKSLLDTIASPAFHHYKEEFDTLGRQISWCYVEDSVITRFRYFQSGDTLTKFHYYTKGKIEHPIYQTEFFVYDKKGNILSYQNSRKSYGNDINTSECSMDKFFYDENFRLTSKLSYSNSHYKQPFSEKLRLADSLLNLVNVYSYQYNKNGKLILMKQMIGKPEYRSVDSFYYDKTNRPIKIVSRQKQAYLGEFPVGNLCGTKIFKYEGNKQIETTWTTYSDWEITKTKTIDEEMNEYIFYPSGLKWMRYYKPRDYPKSRLDYLVYEFY